MYFEMWRYSVKIFFHIPFQFAKVEKKKAPKECVRSLKRLRNEKTFSVRVDPGQTEYEMPLAAPGQRQKKDIKVGPYQDFLKKFV